MHFPIPHHHADAYPDVVCFWRALQKHTALGGLSSSWCSNNCIFSWSQVQPATIKRFFSDVQALWLQMLAPTTTSISLSDTLWETLETVFGCTDIILGSVWSTGSCRDVVLHQAELPFVPKPFSPADIRYACSIMLPAFHSMTPSCVVLSVSHLYQFCTAPPTNRCYLALIPFTGPFSAALRQWEAQ